MGCITSAQPKKVIDGGIRSHTEIMLNRSVTFNEQLRIIIDDDKYKQIEQNTTKYSLDNRENSITTSTSHTQSHSSTAESTTSTQCTNEFSVSHTHSAILHNIVKPQCQHSQSQYASSSIIDNLVTFQYQNGGVTMMGFANNKRVNDNEDNNEDGNESNNSHNDNIEESVTVTESKSDDSEPSIIPLRGSITLMGIASNEEVFVSTNTDLSNNNPHLSSYRNINGGDRKGKNDKDNKNDANIKQDIVTPGYC